ncbi:hypothetical protein [Pseudomonas serbica]|jgi:outer membrane lipoprotein SlyB|uniref:hypothetical protein n=1 Tax=Pseudomonas serbica TaxID=2965074 RepID=UPI00237AF7FB|nr:hypothetical protein [Pseudomonas serbica]
MDRRFLALAMASTMAISGCAGNSGYNEATRMETARVLDVQQVASNGSWMPGAAIGGVAGVLTGGGHSTESKLYRGAGGALIGAAINKVLTTGNLHTSLVLESSRGQMIQVDHDANDLRPGDCVVINTRSNGNVSIQRTSQTQCSF